MPTHAPRWSFKRFNERAGMREELGGRDGVRWGVYKVTVGEDTSGLAAANVSRGGSSFHTHTKTHTRTHAHGVSRGKSGMCCPALHARAGRAGEHHGTGARAHIPSSFARFCHTLPVNNWGWSSVCFVFGRRLRA